MASKRKRPKAKPKKPDFNQQVKKYLNSVQRALVGYLHRVRNFISGIPVWVKSRPQAFRDWRAADKKKKKYRSFRLQKKIKPEVKFLPSSVALFKASLKFLWQQKKVLFSILFIYGIVYIFIIRSSQSANITSLQDSVREAFGGDTSSLSANVATVGAVLGVSGGVQANNATVTTVLTFGMSLIYIWAIRKLHAGTEIKARDAYYQGLAPIVPVLLLLIILSLQLLPLAITSFVYTTARTGGIFASGVEDLGFFIFTVFCGLLSLYLMTSTIIALYIVTLPGMRPIHALRSAKKLVQFQRLNIFKRIIALPIVLGLLYLGILFAIVRFVPLYAFAFTEAFPIIILPLVHTYLYKLYRSLI